MTFLFLMNSMQFYCASAIILRVSSVPSCDALVCRNSSACLFTLLMTCICLSSSGLYGGCLAGDLPEEVVPCVGRFGLALISLTIVKSLRNSL